MAIGFSWGGMNLSFAFIAYLLVSICLGLYLIKLMYTQNKPIAAMIILVLLIIVFFFFGKRWFERGQLKGSASWMQANAIAQSGSSSQCSDASGSTVIATTPTNWPPMINQCPDFMTLNTSNMCVDTNRLYGTGSSVGAFTFSNARATAATSQVVCSNIQNPSSANSVAYLRWEGVVQNEGNCIPGNIGRAPTL